ncbi:MAG: hypothetical protein HN337_01555 [Deltaproteobacteria bacterium]|jgi:sugar lactone lactonase YvrE|nr:hypothetical protein [Deltaproteobacteria bacterium]
MKRISNLCSVIIIIAVSFLMVGCPDSALTVSESSSTGEAVSFVIDGGSVDSAISLGYGETLTFSISYNGDNSLDFECAVVDSDNVEFSDDGGGTVICADGTGTYTAPAATPSEGSLVKVKVSLDLSMDSDGSSAGFIVNGYLEVQLPDISSTLSCTTSTTCAELEPGTFCYFGECVTYEYAGVDTSQTCDNGRSGEGSGDCVGDGVDWVCTSVAMNDCVDYCVDGALFFEDSPNRDECDEDNYIEEYGVCITNDMAICMEDERSSESSESSYDDSCDGSYTCDGCSDIGGTWNLWSSSANASHGLAYYDGSIWSVDNSNGQIHKLDASGNIESSITYPNSSSLLATGLAFDGGGNLWIAKTDGPSMIYMMDASDGSVFGSFRAPGGDSTGLTFVDGYIWNAGFNDNLYKVDPSDGSLLSEYTSPGCGPEGLTYDGTHIWHTDYYSNKIFKIDPASGVAFSVGDSPNNSPIGLTYDSVNEYVYLSASGSIYRMYVGD